MQYGIDNSQIAIGYFNYEYRKFVEEYFEKHFKHIEGNGKERLKEKVIINGLDYYKKTLEKRLESL